MAICFKRIKSLIFLALAISTANISAQDTWVKVLPGVGSFSSPRIAVELGLQNEGSSISSTPWIGDLDKNGFLDIVYIHGTNPKQTYTFDGMRINRIDTQLPVNGEIPWGSYMGSKHNGVYNR